jgi:hypothetical protein
VAESGKRLARRTIWWFWRDAGGSSQSRALPWEWCQESIFIIVGRVMDFVFGHHVVG